LGDFGEYGLVVMIAWNTVRDAEWLPQSCAGKTGYNMGATATTDVTAILPLASHAAGQELVFRVTGGVHNYNVSPHFEIIGRSVVYSGDTINGATVAAFSNTTGDTIRISSDGVNRWNVLSSDGFILI
jgi:hypothetical protein